MRQPINMKIYTVISSTSHFIMPAQNFGGPPLQKKFGGQKNAKFGSILDNFKVRQRISPEQMKIIKIEQVFDLPRFLPR